MKKKIMTGILTAAALSALLLSGCGKTEAPAETRTEEPAEIPDAAEAQEAAQNPVGSSDDSSAPTAEIVIKDYGTIKLRLEPSEAPETVENFISLAKSGFYDGLTFHRIIDGFMIQGGDPDGNGTGGAEKTIRGEFSSNGVENHISHVRGVISMARSQLPDSASSQFFIVQTDSPFLDGEYAGFGYVTEGIEIVDRICKDAQPVDGNGTIPPEAQPVIESIKITD